MKQIQTTTEFVFERTEHGEKFHIRPRFSPDFLCHAPYTFARYEKGPINLDDLCLNCHACNEGYEIVAKKQVEMSNTEPEVPEGYRIMEIGEVLTAECLCWTFAKRWSQYTLSPGSVEGKVGRDHWHICCPIETGEKRDRCQKCGVHQDKVKLVSSEHYHSICNPCLEELHQREFSQNTLVGECDHLQFEYEQANEELCRAQTRIEELEAHLKIVGATADEYHTQTLKDEERIKEIGKRNLDLLEDLQGLHEDLEDLNAANDELNEDDAKQVELVCRLERENQRLMDSDKAMLDTIANLDKRHDERVGDLTRDRDHFAEQAKHWNNDREILNDHITELREKLEKAEAILGRSCKEYLAAYEKEHATVDEYRHATNGHTLANVTKFMEAMPPAEDLEGYELEYSRPSIEESWHAQDTWHENTVCHGRVFIRTPIVEYLTNEEITDELCKELGRIECEVVAYNTYGKPWVDAELVLVQPSPCTYKYLARTDEINTYEQCRIKRSTIEGLRAKKND